MAFAKPFFDAGKLVAAICRGPWTITEISAARGRLMSSCSSIKTDLENAGADWVDQEVVVGRNLVTARSPSEIPRPIRAGRKVRQGQFAASATLRLGRLADRSKKSWVVPRARKNPSLLEVRRSGCRCFVGSSRASGDGPPYGATTGVALSFGARGSVPANGLPSSNQERGAGAPHSVCRCGSRRPHRMGSWSGSTV